MIIESHARQALDGEIAHLDGAQAARAAKRLENLAATRATYKEALGEERDAQLFQWKATIEKNLYDKQRDREFEAALERGETDPVYKSGPAPKLRSPLINWRVRGVNQQWARGMDALLANADAPWSKRATELPEAMDSKMAKLVNKVGESRFFHAKADAFAQLTLARLALHAYRKDNGVYPQSLAQLTPKYLSVIPTDAFADGAPLHYKRNGTRYQLWSLGPNAKDDGARPIIFVKARTDKGKHMVTPEASGDIVANINR